MLCHVLEEIKNCPIYVRLSWNFKYRLLIFLLFFSGGGEEGSNSPGNNFMLNNIGNKSCFVVNLWVYLYAFS